MFGNLSDRLEKSVKYNMAYDAIGVALIRLRRRPWPCHDEKYLVVGCESSGTTVVSHLLLRHGKSRFLLEGINPWVWDLYKLVYQRRLRVEDCLRLQLYDRIKVPGFAAILPQYVTAFPNSRIVYVVRDPRDVLASAFRTFRLTSREQLANIDWVTDTWLGIDATDPVERLATRWRMYLEVSRTVPGIHYIRYEDFCADKLGVIHGLATRMGLKIDDSEVLSRSGRQASDSDARAYQPKGPNSWQGDSILSRNDIQIVERVCGTYMAEWHYDFADTTEMPRVH